jgi:uroporphyrinogen-III synthase
MTSPTSALAGRRVLVTRERLGELGSMLAARGAVAVHAPLIAVREPVDGGAALELALKGLADHDWLIVTSAAGAERVGAAVRRTPGVRLAAVGTATARALEELGGRPVDLVPEVQTAASLATAFGESVESRARVLVVQADRAASTLVERLTEAGHDVSTCVGYRTELLTIDRSLVADADALLLASGSSVEAWVDSVGLVAPPIVVAIGPTTAAAAERFGLKISSVAADHSLAGLVTELERQFSDTPGV